MSKVRSLMKEEIEIIYKEHLVNDFPKEEQKPLVFMLDLYEKGMYPCYGMFEGETLIAYAFLVKTEQESFLLMDYYAVVKEYRSGGYGSRFLKLLQEQCKDEAGIFFEVETGIYEEGKAKEVCERRKSFYLRNGLWMTDLWLLLFTVDMHVMYLPLQEEHISEDELLEQLDHIYQTMFPKKMYEKNIVLKRAREA
ncbi:MAG: GNAT family N-acetyltransferase [Lachnospiraceae bacterium]|nr:GNAT family N-acetyltransferase [Lachnospiraceae bacterium]